MDCCGFLSRLYGGKHKVKFPFTDANFLSRLYGGKHKPDLVS